MRARAKASLRAWEKFLNSPKWTRPLMPASSKKSRIKSVVLSVEPVSKIENDLINGAAEERARTIIAASFLTIMLSLRDGFIGGSPNNPRWREEIAGFGFCWRQDCTSGIISPE